MNNMTPSDEIFIDIWIRLTSDWSRITTFRQMGVLGEDSAREAMHRQNAGFVQDDVANGKYVSMLRDRDAFVQSGFVEKVAEGMTENAVNDFRLTLHAATVVFAHSILDDAIYDCLKICALESPTNWGEYMGNRKFTLKEVENNSYPELLNQAIKADLLRLEKESLLAKVDRVFQICRPQNNKYLTNEFRFDRDRLESLDNLRHRIVHNPGNRWLFDNIYEDLEFMQRSGLHIFSMVGVKYNLVFSGTEVVSAMQNRNSPNAGS
jgi:hypothetical protein